MQPTQTMLKTISKIIKHYNHESNLGKKKDQQSDITLIDHSYKNLILGDTLKEIDYQPMLNKQNEFRYLQAKRTDKRYNGSWLQTYNYCNPNLFKQKLMHKFTLQFKIYQDQLVNHENHVINNVTHRIVKDTATINNLIAVVSNSVNLPHISTHKIMEVYKGPYCKMYLITKIFHVKLFKPVVEKYITHTNVNNIPKIIGVVDSIAKQITEIITWASIAASCNDNSLLNKFAEVIKLEPIISTKPLTKRQQRCQHFRQLAEFNKEHNVKNYEARIRKKIKKLNETIQTPVEEIKYKPPTLTPTPPKFHSTQEATEDSWGSTTTSLFFGAVPTEQELRNEFGDIIKANKKSVVQPPRNNSINPNNLPYTQVQPGEVKPKFVEGTQYVTDSGVVDTSYISGARQVKYKNTDKKTKNKKKSEHNSTSVS